MNFVEKIEINIWIVFPFWFGNEKKLIRANQVKSMQLLQHYSSIVASSFDQIEGNQRYQTEI